MVHVLVNDILIIDKRKWTSKLKAFLTNEV